MPSFILTCSSTVDMPPAYLADREIPYLSYHYILNGKEYPDDFGMTVPLSEFYENISNGAMPTTTQINEAQFTEFFEPLLEAGHDVLHIEMSSGISGTCESALAAQRALSAKYPARTFYVADSLAASSGYGLLVDTAAGMRDAGASIGDTYKWVEDNKLNLHHWVITSDLTHLRRGGRISAASAALGSLLNICPLINMDFHGKLIPRAKMRGMKSAIGECVKRMKQHAAGGTNYGGKCFVSHSACLGDARALAEQVKAAFENLDGDVMINDIGTVIGSHTGPGTVALFYFGDRRVD